MKIGSLCTGYGGLDMAVESFLGAETAWTCEIDRYASQVIEKRINKPNHGDLKSTNWVEVEPIDILTAGYPCQPFSNAGQRKGKDDERHLWPYIKDIVGILRPQYVFLENVRGHFRLGFREVLSDLTSIGYDATWRLIRASDVGAPHRRERLFILAYANVERLQRSSRTGYGFEQSNSQHSDTDGRKLGKRPQRNTWESQFIVSELVEAIQLREVPPPLDKGKLNAKFVEYMMGLPDGWVTDVGLSRSQQLKILGNGVVPQQAELALKLLWASYEQYEA